MQMVRTACRFRSSGSADAPFKRMSGNTPAPELRFLHVQGQELVLVQQSEHEPVVACVFSCLEVLQLTFSYFYHSAHSGLKTLKINFY